MKPTEANQLVKAGHHQQDHQYCKMRLNIVLLLPLFLFNSSLFRRKSTKSAATAKGFESSFILLQVATSNESDILTVTRDKIQFLSVFSLSFFLFFFSVHNFLGKQRINGHLRLHYGFAAVCVPLCM